MTAAGAGAGAGAGAAALPLPLAVLSLADFELNIPQCTSIQSAKDGGCDKTTEQRVMSHNNT